jgi:SAM-dependent methyltransferase
VRETRFLIDRVDAWIYDKIAPYLGERVLEVGCGLGNLMRYMLDRELMVGIDNDPDVIPYLSQAYGARPNVQVHCLDICDGKVSTLKSLMFDTVVSLNVLEHIEDDMLALRHIRGLLGPSGYLVLVVPAHPWLYGTIDRSLGHSRRYSKVSMAEKLVQTGYVPLVQEYMNSVGALGWLISTKILRRREPPSGQLRLFNLIVPMIRAAEQVITPPFGISLVAIAKGAS